MKRVIIDGDKVKVRIDWRDYVDGCKFVCNECKQTFIYHHGAKKHKCPDVIDGIAKDIQEQKLLSSGDK